jgi:hypothetical protein
MAEVFLAESPVEGGAAVPVVVKRLLPGADESHVRLFDRERHALACVASPHVVRLLGAGPDHLVLEYVDGPDLATLLRHLSRRGRRMPLGAAMAVLEGILAGLADLHEARDASGRRLGAVHRDLNPSNVLVSRQGDVKIADLGVVHLDLADQPTQAGLKGTLAYMAPEQLLGRPVDARTDLYAAGLVAYEVLTGTAARPAGMAGLSELMEARSRLPAAPSRVRTDLPPSLDAVLLACLSPRPEDRPADARACLRDLLAAAGTGPDAACLAEEARSVSGPCVRTAATATVGGADEPLPTASPSPPPPADGHRLPRPWRVRRIAPALAVALALSLAAAVAGRSLSEGAGSAPAEALEPESAPVVVSGRSSDAPPAERTGTMPLEGLESSGSVAAITAATAVPTIAQGYRSTAEIRRQTRPLGEPAAQRPVDPGLRVEIRALGDPVHVEGAGARGLAPRLTDELPQGSSLLILHGSDEGLPPVLVRLLHAGTSLTATIGTRPDRHYNRIRCGDRDVGETSAVNVLIEGEMRCVLTGDEGTMAFALAMVRR